MCSASLPTVGSVVLLQLPIDVHGGREEHTCSTYILTYPTLPVSLSEVYSTTHLGHAVMKNATEIRQQVLRSYSTDMRTFHAILSNKFGRYINGSGVAKMEQLFPVFSPTTFRNRANTKFFGEKRRCASVCHYILLLD